MGLAAAFWSSGLGGGGAAIGAVSLKPVVRRIMISPTVVHVLVPSNLEGLVTGKGEFRRWLGLRLLIKPTLRWEATLDNPGGLQLSPRVLRGRK